ncbi:putative ABC transporter ATP-binding protein YbhF [Salinivirga cyanobacteriivorans]|uniref:Putative ABC transporter ATP-binding protein YbhF n=1 Tax=Salinivirga cyanobacteriivorans TaxID=1307839 RepID=A0A0S2I2W8_9BACT|nr:ABC transporter ATP-binding protein [Salinivirga cyanobacteriivorans]ALO16380.1 putative ABC transporter ATP-binding protein YbhF [Salinivirga cyanobacteriivorans]
MIQINNISKNFGEVQAVRDINLEINDSELFGLIGPDGAGKSTLMRLMVTLFIPESGSISMNGRDTIKEYKEIRKHVGYMPGRFSLYQDLSVEENLAFYASVFGSTIEENYDLVKDVYEQIAPFRKRLAGRLSGGMKQKLALSCALIHRPEILVLDEPTTGVDAVSRKEFWEMLKKVQQNGITIVVSTPYMDEASLCDRVALMQKGEILQVDTPSQIIASFPKKLFAVKSSGHYQLLNNLKSSGSIYSVFPFGQYLHVTMKDDDFELNDLESLIQKQGHKNIEVHETKAGIEDVFMYLMQSS